jgi:thiamine transport system ATP-binding protein
MLEVGGVSVSFEGRSALDAVSLGVPTGRTLAVLGPSGSGKTTLLRVVAGLQQPDAGRVVLDGVDVTTVPAHRRGVGLMFQDHVLFPHRDVAGNVGFGLATARASRDEVRRRVARLLELVGLPGTEKRDVRTLSGGEQQRVALARALAPEPRVLLLDEPLGALDGELRERLLADLRTLFAELHLTVVSVTHDVGEAFSLGHEVAVMRRGRCVQAANPDELWRSPADAWVARFLGMQNISELNGRARVIRPEAVRIATGDDAVVLSAERRGQTVRLRVRLDDGGELETETTGLDHLLPGRRVGVTVDPAGVVEVSSWQDPGG